MEMKICEASLKCYYFESATQKALQVTGDTRNTGEVSFR